MEPEQWIKVTPHPNLNGCRDTSDFPILRGILFTSHRLRDFYIMSVLTSLSNITIKTSS